MVLRKGPLLTPVPEPPLTASPLLPVFTVLSASAGASWVPRGFPPGARPAQGGQDLGAGAQLTKASTFPVSLLRGTASPAQVSLCAWSDGQSHPRAGIVLWPRPGEAPPAAGAPRGSGGKNGLCLVGSPDRDLVCPGAPGPGRPACRRVDGSTRSPAGPQPHGHVWSSLPGREPGVGIRWLLHSCPMAWKWGQSLTWRNPRSGE